MIDDERTANEHAHALEVMAWRLLREGRYDDAGTLHDAAECLRRLDDEVSK